MSAAFVNATLECIFKLKLLLLWRRIDVYEDAQWSCAGVESNRDVSCYCHLSMINCPSMSNNSCHNVVGEFCSRLRCNRRYAKPSPVILCAKPAPQFWGKNRGDGFAVWAQARQWWVQQPPGTLTSWHAEAAQVCMSESTRELQLESAT